MNIPKTSDAHAFLQWANELKKISVHTKWPEMLLTSCFKSSIFLTQQTEIPATFPFFLN